MVVEQVLISLSQNSAGQATTSTNSPSVGDDNGDEEDESDEEEDDDDDDTSTKKKPRHSSQPTTRPSGNAHTFRNSPWYPNDRKGYNKLQTYTRGKIIPKLNIHKDFRHQDHKVVKRAQTKILREFPVLKREATPFTINALLARQLAYARSKVNAAGNDGSESDADAGTTSDNAEAGATLDGAETVGNEPDTYPGFIPQPGPVFQIGGQIINPYGYDESIPAQPDIEAINANSGSFEQPAPPPPVRRRPQLQAIIPAPTIIATPSPVGVSAAVFTSASTPISIPASAPVPASISVPALTSAPILAPTPAPTHRTQAGKRKRVESDQENMGQPNVKKAKKTGEKAKGTAPTKKAATRTSTRQTNKAAK